MAVKEETAHYLIENKTNQKSFPTSLSVPVLDNGSLDYDFGIKAIKQVLGDDENIAILTVG